MERSTLFSILALMFACCPVANGQDMHAFVPNQGQWDGPHSYRAELGRLTLFVEKDRLTWSLLEQNAGEIVHDALHDEVTPDLRGHAWQVIFEGADPQGFKEEGPSRHYTNYFLGNDRERWRGHVHAFNEVLLPELWKGVDLRMHTMEGRFKYDLIVSPEADLNEVRFRYAGTDGLSINAKGDLVIRTSVGEVIEQSPVAWYADGDKEAVPCRYVLSDGVLGYVLPGADRHRPVVIDPVLVASTLSGATGASNYGHCATYDLAGNIYSGARNFGPTYPVTLGAFQTAFGGGGVDISLSKYNPDGSQLLWASYLGGTQFEYPHSLITTAAQQLCVLGSSGSIDYPTTASAFSATLAGQSDIVATVIAADGASLIGSTYVGGSGQDGVNSMSGNYGENYRGEVFLDASEDLVIASFSSSTDLPVTAGVLQPVHGGGQDGALLSLDLSCSNLIYCTYLGGSAADNVLGVRVDDDGTILVTGATESTDMPMATSGFQTAQLGGREGYVLRLSDGATAILNGTFVGTTASDRPYFIDTDDEGDVWIYGQTAGVMPIQPPGTIGDPGGNIFIIQYDPGLNNQLVVSTLGNTGTQNSTVPVAFLVDVCNKVYISGYNSINSLPITSDALYPSGSFYLAAFETDMTTQLYGTYYGGSHVDGGTSRFDKNGIVYQGVCSGQGSLQTTPWAWSPNQSIGWDIGVFKIDFQQSGVTATAYASDIYSCAPSTVDLTAIGNAPYYVWDLGDGSPPVTGSSVSHVYTQPGTYTVLLVGIDSNTCNVVDTGRVTLFVNAPGSLQAGFVVTPSSDCSVLEVLASDTTAGALLIRNWDMGDGTWLVGSTVQHVYQQPGTYTITLTVVDTICGDTSTASFDVTLSNALTVNIGPDQGLCPGEEVQLDAGVPNATYLWSTAALSRFITVDQQGTYWVQVDLNGCTGSDTLDVWVFPDPGNLDGVMEACSGDVVELTIPIDGTYNWSVGGNTQSILVDSMGTYAFQVTDENGCVHAGEIMVVADPGEIEVEVPNVISPNGDGFNDRFEPQTTRPEEVMVTIYNRWGMEMFTNANMSRLWDGKFNGDPVPEGTYFYIVKYRPSCVDDDVVKTGHVTVVR